MPTHVHSYEESLYVLDGEVVLQTPGEAARLGPGDYGLIPVGVAHSLRNEGSGRSRWARMSAPAPRAAYDTDTYLVPELPDRRRAGVDVRDPRTRRFGHVDPANMDPAQQTQDKLAVSASMRTALLVYSGITVKMMVDSDLGRGAVDDVHGAVRARRRRRGARPPVRGDLPDHRGSVEATFDGERRTCSELGDAAWAGVGCVHGFRNVGDGPVRWLETQAPAPPGRHSYRFARDWAYLPGPAVRRTAQGAAR